MGSVKRIKRRVDPVERLVEAARLVSKGELDRAAEICERVLEKHPRRTDALELRAIVALRQEDHQRAWDALEIAIAEGETAKRWIARARAGLGLTRWDDVEVALKRALALDPSEPAIYEVEAELHHARGKHEDALASARGALALEPSRVMAHGLEAMALGALGRDDEAIEAYRAAVRARHGEAHDRQRLLHAMAELLDRRGEADEARQARGLADQLAARDGGRR